MAENTNSSPNPNPNVTVTISEETNKETNKHNVVENEKSDNKEMKVMESKYVRILSICTYLLSLPILGSVIFLLIMKDYDCEKLLNLPKLQLGFGIFMIFVFIISNVVVVVETRHPIAGFFMVMVPLIVIFTIGLALLGAYAMGSRGIMATPMWFKDKVRDQAVWTNIKSCIYSKKLCEDLAFRSLNLQQHDFSIQKLSSLESGCCKPPEMCEMEYVNATFWRRPKGFDDKVGGDCDTWNNNDTVLCYDCYSCKKGFVEIMESKWWLLGLFLILASLLLILSHASLFVAVMWDLSTPFET